MSGFRWTQHALDRLRERFPGETTEMISRAVKTCQRGDWTTYVSLDDRAKFILNGASVVTVIRQESLAPVPKMSRKDRKRLAKGIISVGRNAEQSQRRRNHVAYQLARRASKRAGISGRTGDVLAGQSRIVECADARTVEEND